MKKTTYLILAAALLISCCSCKRATGFTSDNSSIKSSSVNLPSNISDSTTQTSNNSAVSEINSSNVSSISEAEKQKTPTESRIKEQTSETKSDTTVSDASPAGGGQVAAPTLPESLNWTSVYGGNDWVFVTDDKTRDFGSDIFVLRFNANENEATSLFQETYSLSKEGLSSSPTNPTFEYNGQTYYRGSWCEYSGNIFTYQGQEDIVHFELKCYDASGRYFMTDDLQFKRLDSNTLQYIGDENIILELNTGDIFKR